MTHTAAMLLILRRCYGGVAPACALFSANIPTTERVLVAQREHAAETRRATRSAWIAWKVERERQRRRRERREQGS
jgi:hypothetical protein